MLDEKQHIAGHVLALVDKEDRGDASIMFPFQKHLKGSQRPCVTTLGGYIEFVHDKAQKRIGCREFRTERIHHVLGIVCTQLLHDATGKRGFARTDIRKQAKWTHGMIDIVEDFFACFFVLRAVPEEAGIGRGFERMLG